MKLEFSIKFKIFFLLSVIILITFIGALAIINHSTRTGITLNNIVNEKIEIYRASTNLETALSNQKGFLTYFFLDEDITWLEQLGKYREIFENELNSIKQIVKEEKHKKLITQIEEHYAQYIQTKDLVIESYQSANKDEISQLHKKQRDMFFEILDLCQSLRTSQWEKILVLKKEADQKAHAMRNITAASVLFLLGAYALILWLLSSKLLSPLTKLAYESGGTKEISSKDQIKYISENLKGMKRLYDNTATELIKSRESLEHAERLALVGKLAAGVAHTIRNPFTSIKMRLFSLSRSLELSKNNEEDFQVISDEIARIDNIVQNFLEFSRLPKLKKENCQTYQIITSVMQLLEHRLKTFDVHAKYLRSRHTPVIYADPDRIKEAIINLIINACEAMENGGAVEISENINDQFVQIKIKDTGPGIPEEIQEKILQPFYTTKDYGSGLGLSIVHKIVAEHNGELSLNSSPKTGTEFILSIPKGECKND